MPFRVRVGSAISMRSEICHQSRDGIGAIASKRLYVMLTNPRRKSHPLPPGPSPDPLIGNLRHLPSEYQQRTFAEWSARYGDVISISLFSKSIVILNSAIAAHDLLEKRSNKYSDRPRFVLLTELMGWDNVVTHFPYGPRFRRHRRLIQDGFNPKSIPDFEAVKLKEARNLLHGLLESPDLFRQHFSRFAAGSILRLTYGHTVTSLDDSYVCTAEETAKATVEAGSPGSMLVDFFPALKYIPVWMPFTGFKRNALAVRAMVDKMLSIPFEAVKEQMKLGTAVSSFTSNLLDACTKGPDGKVDSRDELDIKGAAGVLYGAAVDTTCAVLGTFMLAMVIHTDVYRAAQAEVDAVIGPDRLPTLADRHSLPYLDCVLKEVYRWNAAVPLAIPHKASVEDVYRGYRIPKDAIIIPNVWAMTRDPSIYPDPDVFRPSRFTADNGMQPAPDPREVVFGFGRRACAGRQFGDDNVWLVMASIVASFTIERALDSFGQEEIPRAQFTSGFVSHARPFKCKISPRSPRAIELVKEAWADEGL